MIRSIWKAKLKLLIRVCLVEHLQYVTKTLLQLARGEREREREATIDKTEYVPFLQGLKWSKACTQKKLSHI